MNNSILRAVLMVAGVSFLTVGCATKGYVSKQITPLQAQMASMTDELVRIDQSIQSSRGMAGQQEPASGMAAQAGSSATSARVYRTPSGFELPAVNIQQALRNAGYYHGNMDGKIGSGTEAAVRNFQRDNGLHTDGVVGRNTWDKLKPYLSTVK